MKNQKTPRDRNTKVMSTILACSQLLTARTLACFELDGELSRVLSVYNMK